LLTTVTAALSEGAVLRRKDPVPRMQRLARKLGALNWPV